MTTSSSKTAVITGASSGIGLQTAISLAASGWRIIATGRNPERSKKAESEIRQASTSGQVDMLLGDLSLMAGAKQLADQVAGLTDRIDVLINNAGAIATQKVITREGLEENLAANHLGPFLLTNYLLPLLRKAVANAETGTVRILMTSSDGSEMIPGFNLDDMQNLKNYSVGLAYCTGKLANVLFAKALAKRLVKDGIIAHAMHPGTVESNFMTNLGEEGMARVKSQPMLTSDEGADTLIWLATSDEAGQTNGGYFYQRTPRKPNPVVDDEQTVERFWQETEKLILSVDKDFNSAC